MNGFSAHTRTQTKNMIILASIPLPLWWTQTTEIIKKEKKICKQNIWNRKKNNQYWQCSIWIYKLIFTANTWIYPEKKIFTGNKIIRISEYCCCCCCCDLSIQNNNKKGVKKSNLKKIVTKLLQNKKKFITYLRICCFSWNQIFVVRNNNYCPLSSSQG